MSAGNAKKVSVVISSGTWVSNGTSPAAISSSVNAGLKSSGDTAGGSSASVGVGGSSVIVSVTRGGFTVSAISVIASVGVGVLNIPATETGV